MPPPVTPLINLFPPPPGLTFAQDPAFQAAVAAALAELIAARKVPMPFSIAIIDLGGGSATETLKWGAHKPGEEHYIASVAKIAAMYAGFALRDMVRRLASFTGLLESVAAGIRRGAGNKPAPPQPLLKSLQQYMDPAIDIAVGGPLATAVRREHRIPHYDQVFTLPGADRALQPEFKGTFVTALREMIVPSSNSHAGQCVRGVGYGYLNGALEAAGLFDRKTQTGLWLAGDFVGIWPYARINSANDGLVAQAGSALAVAKLLALIVNGAVVDAPAQQALLKAAAEGPDQPWLSRTEAMTERLALPRAKITHAKLGLGPLKKGGDVYSEVFRIEGLRKPGKSYAVAFQNLKPPDSTFDDAAFMVRRSIELYER
jgi:hypothetical protein